MTKIMYVCESCQENAPEMCGRSDVTDLRVMPSGRAVCDDCYTDADVCIEEYPEIHANRMSDDDAVNDQEFPLWREHPVPAEYVEARVAPHGDGTIDLANASDLIGLAAMMIQSNAADPEGLLDILEGAFEDEGTGDTLEEPDQAAVYLIRYLKIVGRHEALEGAR